MKMRIRRLLSLLLVLATLVAFGPLSMGAIQVELGGAQFAPGANRVQPLPVEVEHVEVALLLLRLSSLPL